MATEAQKFIGQNRAPRVQVEYDVELYGAEKKVNLPFVMGVISDLSGKPAEPLPRVEDRNFTNIDAENLDARMQSIKPRVAFQVPNVMTGEGNLSVELTFNKLEDFNPDKVAAKVEGLKQLLEARKQLSNLLSYMDGKSGAEDLIAKLLADPTLLKALSAHAKESKDVSASQGQDTASAEASAAASVPGQDKQPSDN